MNLSYTSAFCKCSRKLNYKMENQLEKGKVYESKLAGIGLKHVSVGSRQTLEQACSSPIIPHNLLSCHPDKKLALQIWRHFVCGGVHMGGACVGPVREGAWARYTHASGNQRTTQFHPLCFQDTLTGLNLVRLQMPFPAHVISSSPSCLNGRPQVR